MCLESDKNRARKQVREGPCGLCSHTYVHSRRTSTLACFRERPGAPQDALPHVTAQLGSCLDPHCLEGHAEPLGLAQLPSSLFSLNVATGPTGPPISKQSSLRGPSSIPLSVLLILLGLSSVPSFPDLPQILPFLGSLLELFEKGLKVL